MLPNLVFRTLVVSYTLLYMVVLLLLKVMCWLGRQKMGLIIMVFLKDGSVTIGGTEELLFFSLQLLVCLLLWLVSSELVSVLVLTRAFA